MCTCLLQVRERLCDVSVAVVDVSFVVVRTTMQTCAKTFQVRERVRGCVQFCCRCENDYVDVYAQLQHEDEDLLDAELTERFCGESMDNLPNLIVSTNNLLVLSFFTNSHKGNRGFQGSFEFFDDCECNKLYYLAPRCSRVF